MCTRIHEKCALEKAFFGKYFFNYNSVNFKYICKCLYTSYVSICIFQIHDSAAGVHCKIQRIANFKKMAFSWFIHCFGKCRSGEFAFKGKTNRMSSPNPTLTAFAPPGLLTLSLFSGSTSIMPRRRFWQSGGMKWGIWKIPRFTFSSSWRRLSSSKGSAPCRTKGERTDPKMKAHTDFSVLRFQMQNGGRGGV